ncbi:hypothetical protein VNO77_14235 [Canavalia gladiata]|uniref:Uncharacterized protein n=1 Tax=Canavalia gladiata TaxID=3824 RepID=A0AAN9LYI9_CANGL
MQLYPRRMNLMNAETASVPSGAWSIEPNARRAGEPLAPSISVDSQPMAASLTFSMVLLNPMQSQTRPHYDYVPKTATTSYGRNFVMKSFLAINNEGLTHLASHCPKFRTRIQARFLAKQLPYHNPAGLNSRLNIEPWPEQKCNLDENINSPAHRTEIEGVEILPGIELPLRCLLNLAATPDQRSREPFQGELELLFPL